MSVTTINPATGATLATYESHDDDAVDRLLSAAHAATANWGLQPLDVRTATVARLAAVLRGRADDIAALITAEMGKPLSEALGEVEKSAVTAEFYAAHAGEFLGDTPVAIDGVDAWVAREPMGLVLAIMPWNFPLWQAMRFALPAIAAGNGVFLKHSPNVTGSALLIQELCWKAGLPAGVFTTVVLEEPRVPAVTKRLIADDRIAAVTLTGSNRAGAAVGAAAGRAVKPSVLELGGSDAFVVLSDADVQAAAAAAVKARFLNAGQSCVCAKRFIVESTVADEFTEAFVAGATALAVGDPTAAGTQMGPLARADLRDAIARQVRESAGARVLTGGVELPGPGYFYAPTVLTGTGPGMPAFDEETFGPLAAIAVAADEKDAVRLANATRFGLGLSVWSRDTSRAAAFARQVTSGAAFINAMVASDARIPFGGTKQSGYGRELSDIGMFEFVNTRTYWSVR
jgi:succinate-semialdehyde dehydrogenase/glutarate-semialdehyde dehydrogenase